MNDDQNHNVKEPNIQKHLLLLWFVRVASASGLCYREQMIRRTRCQRETRFSSEQESRWTKWVDVVGGLL